MPELIKWYMPDDVSPLYHTVGGYNVRINDLEMSQSAIAAGIWSTIILRERPARVIEIGTCKGGFSALLSYVCQSVGASFSTMDVRDSLQYELAGCGQFLIWDCFEHEHEITQLLQLNGLSILLCDGGNKMNEFKTFAPSLKSGDIIAAHDCVNVRAVKEGEPTADPTDFIGWGFNEVHLHKMDLAGLEKFEPYWTEMSGWTVWKKL